MSTDRIRSGASAIDLIRSLSAEGARTRSGASSQGTTTVPQSRGDPAVLRARLGELVRGVDPDDTNEAKALQRPVLREILLWEFGADFRQNPEFQSMLDSVERTMRADPRFASRFASLLRSLRG